jgi:hypothetical protein
MTVLALDHTVGRCMTNEVFAAETTLKAEPDSAPSNCQKEVGRCVMRYAQAADGRFRYIGSPFIKTIRGRGDS